MSEESDTASHSVTKPKNPGPFPTLGPHHFTPLPPLIPPVLRPYGSLRKGKERVK